LFTVPPPNVVFIFLSFANLGANDPGKQGHISFFCKQNVALQIVTRIVFAQSPVPLGLTT